MHLPHAERGHGKRRLGRALAGGQRDRAVPGEQPGRGNYLPAPRGTNALVTKQLARRKGVTVHVASSPWQTRAPDRILENTGELAIGVRRREPSLVLQELYYSFLPGGQTCKVTEPENVELGAESPAIDAGQPQASSTADSSKSLAPSWAIRARTSLTRQGRSSVDMGRRVLGIWRHRADLWQGHVLVTRTQRHNTLFRVPSRCPSLPWLFFSFVSRFCRRVRWEGPSFRTDTTQRRDQRCDYVRRDRFP